MLTLAFALFARAQSAGEVKLEYTQFDLQLREIETPETVNSTGTTFGSDVGLNNVIQDFRTNETLGRLQGFCFVTAGLTVTGQIQFECLGTIIFSADNSSFSITGPFNPMIPTDQAVIGGTGRFSGATGVARLSTLVNSPTDVPPSIFAFNVRLFALARPIQLPALR
ncbi:hypothetical protein KFL_005240060 [Klebsormidium nitens]|uniref:Dirigent protein n=1 Tax=Klebsormidium nitens TaxID=105231 RepID=A0A1Y1IL15_KLENI|nr:hypothetical protein KFL_005240060 [Klebsormidium nitens]|eukprot:GAQ89446.1 hypothetical protein KFL_005240060 [Klebsormidium nitens]